MNQKQKIALWLGLGNLALILLFPPFDSFSFTDAKALIFSGFHFVFSRSKNEVINTDVLFLEHVVLLVNVGIAWLLLRNTSPSNIKPRFNYQNAILLGVAANLIIILLFPPFEYFYAISSVLLPTFEGFYFVFSAGPLLAIVSPILYLEVVFVLFNGGGIVALV